LFCILPQGFASIPPPGRIAGMSRTFEHNDSCPRRCALLRAHLGKGCASSKKSPRFSKMRTFEFGAHLRMGCAPSNQGAALDPVPLARKVAHPPASASIALFGHSSWLGPCRRRWAHLAVSSSCGKGPQGKTHRSTKTSSSSNSLVSRLGLKGRGEGSRFRAVTSAGAVTSSGFQTVDRRSRRSQIPITSDSPRPARLCRLDSVSPKSNELDAHSDRTACARQRLTQAVSYGNGFGPRSER
jgi:hypothetical protein